MGVDSKDMMADRGVCDTVGGTSVNQPIRIETVENSTK
jgi:hypothetical protein